MTTNEEWLIAQGQKWQDNLRSAYGFVQAAKLTMPESARQDVENAEAFLQSALAKAAQSGEKVTA